MSLPILTRYAGIWPSTGTHAQNITEYRHRSSEDFTDSFGVDWAVYDAWNGATSDWFAGTSITHSIKVSKVHNHVWEDNGGGEPEDESYWVNPNSSNRIELHGAHDGYNGYQKLYEFTNPPAGTFVPASGGSSGGSSGGGPSQPSSSSKVFHNFW